MIWLSRNEKLAFHINIFHVNQSPFPRNSRKCVHLDPNKNQSSGLAVQFEYLNNWFCLGCKLPGILWLHIWWSLGCSLSECSCADVSAQLWVLGVIMVIYIAGALSIWEPRASNCPVTINNNNNNLFKYVK